MFSFNPFDLLGSDLKVFEKWPFFLDFRGVISLAGRFFSGCSSYFPVYVILCIGSSCSSFLLQTVLAVLCLGSLYRRCCFVFVR